MTRMANITDVTTSATSTAMRNVKKREKLVAKYLGLEDFVPLLTALLYLDKMYLKVGWVGNYSYDPNIMRIFTLL